jgi:hypothetical protein
MMNTRRLVLFSLTILAALALVSACSPAAPATPEYAAATEAPAEMEVVQTVEVAAPAAQEAPPPAAGATVVAVSVEYQPAVPGSERMIIKNADLRLLVQDTDAAIDGINQAVGDIGGYIISQRVWYETHNEQNYKYATITMGVPVDEFEFALRRLRGLAVRVLDENASGEDVTTEYVDLQSRLKNLELTRDRIREFLDQAKTVEEALKVNQQLSQVEEEIEQVQGRMKYLAGRAAYSTITVNLEPDIPQITPTATPTRTPTPTPTPWTPRETIKQAGSGFVDLWQGVVDFSIRFMILGVPCLLPFVGFGVLIWWLVARRRKNKVKVKEEQQPPVKVEETGEEGNP